MKHRQYFYLEIIRRDGERTFPICNELVFSDWPVSQRKREEDGEVLIFFLAQVSRRPCHRLNVISHRSMSSNNFQGTRRDNSGRIIKIIISKEDGG